MKEILRKLNACHEAREWVGNKPAKEAWDTCPRGDWMLWIYSRLYPKNQRELTLAKGHCANTVRHLMTDPRSIAAVDAAIAYGEGRIDKSELQQSARAAATAAAAAAGAAAADAAAAAGAYAYAYAYAADAADAIAAADAYAYAYAANAADNADDADAAAYAAYDAARTKNRQQTADICRRYLTIPTI